MYSRLIPPASSLRIILIFTICTALLPLSDILLLVRGNVPQQDGRREGRPRPDKPEGTLPNLGEVRNGSHTERDAPPPIPSTMRSPKVSLQPWNGRRVGDSEPPVKTDPREEQTRRAHARRRLKFSPSVLDDQFVQNFFSWTVLRAPNASESAYWNDQLRAAYGQGQESLRLAALELGKTMFESAEYLSRNRDNHWYVYDLYKTYLMRNPDSSGWTSWETSVPGMGRENVRRGFEESTEFATLIGNIVPNGSATLNAASLISARVDPRNEPGNGLLTRDATWSVSLLGLPGRAGLDLGLALSYSSMVWTRSGPYIYFDEDNAFPSPGFRLGFPTIQRKVFDAQTARNAYLLITAAGRRVELKQVGTSNVYDATDSSYLRLTDNSSTLLVNSTDGIKLSFTYANNEYRCTEVKDRNGNYVTINYNSLGRLTNITDTLGRVITFNYDSNANLLSITQSWSGQPSHQWVSFGWSTRTMQSSFTSAAVVGTANNTVLPVITQVALNDTSHFTFDYTNSLQVSLIKNYFGTTERNATTFTYETLAGDVPRLLDGRVSARNWTGINGVPSQVVTTYSLAGDGACVLTAPDGTVYKEYYGTGWQRGLTTLSELWSGGVRQKWTTTAWTQDNTSVGYEVNPRVTETNVYDASGNRRRTVIDYGSYAQYGLPYGVHEFAADGVTDIRQTYTDYNLSQAYLDRRIIGLISQVQVSNGTQWQSKITYDYDDPARLHGVPAATTQHDVNYNLLLTARGNLTAVFRWDVTDINNPAKKLTTYTNYYNTGTPIFTTDPAGHQSNVTYADSFSDSVNRNTFAYPTTITDADGFSSYVQYNYDFGATTRTQSPAPAGQTQGAIQTITYNSLGQLDRITTTNNGAYRRFWYGLDYLANYSTVSNVADESYSIEIIDGLGQVIGAAGNHPGSTGGYRLVSTIYDQMGRHWKVSNPTEVNSSWVPSGDDSAGLYYTQQTYDWKGRPRITTNPDNTTKEASYAGCGCAGGEVVTLTDEGTIDSGVAKRRQRKIYSDVLGRTVKTEMLNWQGGSVYSATVNTYNSRDQIEGVREYGGPEGSSSYQTTILTYDGYGRLKTKHAPEQSVGTATTYNYNNDDTLLSVVDARGAATIYAYNNRHLVSGISYTAPQGSGIAIPATVSYGYDAAGNRTSMIDGLGSVSYSYDALSRMKSETRNINQPTTPLSFSISYEYNLANQLRSITDPHNKTIEYAHDYIGRLSAITGSTFGGVSSYLSALQYRAWGAVKHASMGNGKTLDATYNNRLQAASVQIPNVISKTYDYYADGTLKFSSDLLDHRFDRLYRWDHAGRIKEAYSGADARGQGPSTDRPYKQLYGYDPMGHLTQRTNNFWSVGPGTTSDSYTNDRHDPVGQLWPYDDDGNLLAMPYTTYTYDAGGRIDSAWSGGSATFGFDGDGKKVKSVEVVWDAVQESDVTTYSFSIYSSVLGRVLTEKFTNDDPDSPYSYFTSRTFVYGDRGVIAWQESNASFWEYVWWEHRDPSNASYRTYGLDNQPGERQELDPLGNNQGTSDTTSQQSIPDQGILAAYPASNNPSQPNTTYSIDGIRVSLDDFIQNLQIFYKGDLGLNEALAKQSANDANYQRRWVKSYVEITSSSAYELNDEDAIVFNAGTVRVPIGYWTTSALSLASSLASLIGFQGNMNKVVPLPSDLRDRVANRVNNPATDCGEFIKKVIREAARLRGKAYSDDPLDVFDRIKREGGFQLRVQKNSGESAVTLRGKRIIYLNRVWEEDDPRRINHVQNAYANVVLNEIMHQSAGGGSMYSDRTLARALFNSLSPAEQSANPLPKKSGTELNGRYFHRLLTERCPSP